nr:xylulose kinase-1 [Tanacetum cinerariifolium]
MTNIGSILNFWPRCKDSSLTASKARASSSLVGCGCEEYTWMCGEIKGDKRVVLVMYIVPTGRVIVATGRYVVPAEEHIAVQRESKARTTLLHSIPDDHVADFHYMDDARDIWNAIKARFGGNSKSKKMRKSMLKQEFSEFRIGEADGLHKGSQDAGDAGEFALMGVTSETKLDNHLARTEKWRNSSKNLFKLIDSSMSIRTKVGLGFTNCIGENELGWDDSAFSVFTTNSEDVEGRPIFHRFAKTDSMKDVPPPLTEYYTSLSDHTDLDESQMSYGTKSSTSSDSKSVSNDFVFCDDSDKSLEVNTNDFASSDSSVKSSEHKPTDSTSCASTSSVSTNVNEAEIESNVGTPIKEPIIVQDLPSFTCNSSYKNEHTSRTSFNKNGYFNKKAGHFRKNASSVSKLCFVCGSGTHLIKDCDFYEKQMANKTVGIGVGHVHSRNKVNHQIQFVPQAVLLRIGKVNIPPAIPQPVPTGKAKVFALVPAGGQNKPFTVPTVRGYSPSVISGWWKSTARPKPHFSRPKSSYFQTYAPIMYYHHMKYGEDRWTTTVKPSVG